MFTITYRRWTIHGYYDRNEVRVQSPKYKILHLRSLPQAKRVIRRATRTIR